MSTDILPLRFSWLKQIAKSPAHALYAMEHDIDDTPYLRLGRLVHSIVLGEFANPVWTGDRRGKEWLAFKAEHEGEDIVTEKEVDQAQAMALALAAHEEASKFLYGIREQTLTFQMAGRNCRATPDARHGAAAHLSDLKSTTNASPHRFPWQALQLGYHAQLAFYKDACVAAGLPPPRELALVAVEVKPPHAVAVYVLTERAEDFGRRTYRLWMEQFLNCERSGVWPGYPMGTLDAPEEGVELVGVDGEVIEVE